MSKYEDTVMAAIKDLEEKLEEAMEVNDAKPKPKGMVGKIMTSIGIK